MKQIVSALLYIHSKNIVHRDLKPENLILTSEGSSQLKLIDFGVSASVGTEKRLTETVGTLIYMAPEVLKHSYDEKCDI